MRRGQGCRIAASLMGRVSLGNGLNWIEEYAFSLTLRSSLDEKEMATHSSILAWRIPGTVEPGGLPSMGSHKVGHD